MGKTEKILKPFEQVDNSDTRSYEGTGLGLAICQHFVHILGGEIAVSSVEGKGSSFIFEVPFQIETEPDSTTNQTQELGPDFSDKDVLIVEDNTVNRDILLKIMAKTNANCDNYPI